MKSLGLFLISLICINAQTELKQGTGSGTGIYYSPNNIGFGDTFNRRLVIGGNFIAIGHAGRSAGATPFYVDYNSTTNLYKTFVSDMLEIQGHLDATTSTISGESNFVGNIKLLGGSNSTIRSTGSDGQLLFVTGGRSGSTGNANLVLKNDFTSYFNGNIGIGTTNPSNLLSIAGNLAGGSSPYNDVINYDTNHWGVIGHDGGYPVFRFFAKGTGADIVNTHANVKPSMIKGQNGIIFYTSESTGLNNSSNLQSRMVIASNGKVGIGTTNPVAVLDVRGDIAFKYGNGIRVGSDWGTDGSPWVIKTSWESGKGDILDFFVPGYGQENKETRMTILQNGYVGIGTREPESRLAVNGTITAKKIRITANIVGGADFVFEDDYNLKPLSEIETFIKKNKHLPEIPPAKEMQKNGLDMSEFQIKLLQKIEEQTLHMISMNKKLEAQQKQIKEQQKQIITLQNQMLNK